MRLIDADAYSAEMKDRQDAAWEWRNEAIEEEDEVKLARAEGAFTAFTEAKLTMDKHIISPWHRVEEELPKFGEYVLAWEIQGFAVVDKYVGIGDGRWGLENDGAIYTHWMPLPEPPKEDA